MPIFLNSLFWDLLGKTVVFEENSNDRLEINLQWC